MNVIAIHSRSEFESFSVATNLCKLMRVSSKPMRVAIFNLIQFRALSGVERAIREHTAFSGKQAVAK